MPNTARRAYPYPAATVAPDVPVDLQKLAEALDTDIDAILSRLISPRMVWFRASQLNNVAWNAGANLGFSAYEDAAAGWSSANNQYVVPVAGLYMLTAAFKQASAVGAGIMIRVNGANALFSANAAATAFSGASIAAPLRLAKGDTVSLRVTANITTQNDAPAHNNVLTLAQVDF